jgi:hypothetical protein
MESFFLNTNWNIYLNEKDVHKMFYDDVEKKYIKISEEKRTGYFYIPSVPFFCKTTPDINGLKFYKMYVHRAVMMHILKRAILPKMDIDHIDRDKKNNCQDNLRECTRSENLKNRNPWKKKKKLIIL